MNGEIRREGKEGSQGGGGSMGHAAGLATLLLVTGHWRRVRIGEGAKGGTRGKSIKKGGDGRKEEVASKRYRRGALPRHLCTIGLGEY